MASGVLLIITIYGLTHTVFAPPAGRGAGAAAFYGLHAPGSFTAATSPTTYWLRRSARWRYVALARSVRFGGSSMPRV